MNSDDFDFVNMWVVFWKQKKFAGIVVVLFAVISAIYALSQTNIYRSQALLAPVESSQSSSPLLSQFGSAASLVGVSIPNQSGDRVSTVIATMNSREFLR